MNFNKNLLDVMQESIQAWDIRGKKLFSNKKIPNIDLHLHTNYTDGKHSPKEMIDFAKKKKNFSITF